MADSGGSSPATTVLEDQLCFALYAATNTVVRAYRPLLDRIGLTYPQYLIMLVLFHSEAPLSVNELGDRLQLAPSAVSPMLDRMEAGGLITKQRDHDDRRRVAVSPTAAGRALERDIAEIQDAVACQTSLAGDELAEMRRRLHDLVDRMTGDAVWRTGSG